MNEEIYEGYDFLVALMAAHRRQPILFHVGFNPTELGLVKFGLKIEWLQHKRGVTPTMNGSFVWTEKAEREISHLDELE